MSNLDRSQIEESYIENGITIETQVNGNQTYGIEEDCKTTIIIDFLTCTHGGNHWIGDDRCRPSNNAQIKVRMFTTCKRTITSETIQMSKVIIDNNPNHGGGGGGNSSQAQYNSFMNLLSVDSRNWFDENTMSKGTALLYLRNKNYSVADKHIVSQLITFISNDSVLKNNDYLSELIIRQILFSNKYTSNEFFSFWSSLTQQEKQVFNQFVNNNLTTGSSRAIEPSKQTFLLWTFNYLIDNPTVTVEQFENWFSLEGSLNNDLIKELQPYTTLKFDEFININKDLDDLNVYLQNSNPLDSPWLKQAREYAQKLESWSSSLGPKAKQKARETIDETFVYALNKTAEYLYSNVGNLTEVQKESQFQNNGKNGVAILLHDFANGLGKNTRNFPLNYDITQQFIAGNVLNDIKSDFLTKLTEKNLTYNQFVSNGNTINGGYAFSPDHTSVQDSFDKHINANWVQFFIGGAITTYQPTNDYGWINDTIL